MSKTVFISGSISIKKLPLTVQESIDKIIVNQFKILIGDASGIDTLVQEYCSNKEYSNVVVYSISKTPRYLASSAFEKKHIFADTNIKKERERQQEKDKAMTADSDFTFSIWDGVSKGSYTNIIRALEQKKKIKVYLSSENNFLDAKKLTKYEMTFIYRENNGYSASEVINYLKEEGIDTFQKTQDLNKYLIAQTIITKEDNIYTPLPQYIDLFIIDKYRGKVKGIKFKNEFIEWIEKNRVPEQGNLF